jgi:hypothetical protein
MTPEICHLMLLLESCSQQEQTGNSNHGTHMLIVQLFHTMFAVEHRVDQFCFRLLLSGIMHWFGVYKFVRLGCLL